MQQTVVNQCVRAQLLPAARLTTVTNTDNQRIALPAKVLAANLAAVWFQRIHPHQPMNQVRHAAQRGFEFFWRFGGDARAEAAGGHIDKAGFVVHLGDIDRHVATGNGEFQRISQIRWNIDAGGKIVGGTERQNAESRYLAAFTVDQRRRDFVNRPVAAARDHRLDVQANGLFHITYRIAFLPGDANINGHPFITQQFNRLAELGGIGTLAV